MRRISAQYHLKLKMNNFLAFDNGEGRGGEWDRVDCDGARDNSKACHRRYLTNWEKSAIKLSRC